MRSSRRTPSAPNTLPVTTALAAAFLLADCGGAQPAQATD